MGIAIEPMTHAFGDALRRTSLGTLAAGLGIAAMLLCLLKSQALANGAAWMFVVVPDNLVLAFVHGITSRN